MRVIATITVDGREELVIEGDSPFMGGGPGDSLEEKGLGIWLTSWRYAGERRGHKGKVFAPWTSVLMVRTKDGLERLKERSSQ